MPKLQTSYKVFPVSRGAGSKLLTAKRTGLVLGPDGAPAIQLATPLPEARFLQVGDKVRALGYVYRVRKVTGKDVVLRPLKEN